MPTAISAMKRAASRLDLHLAWQVQKNEKFASLDAPRAETTMRICAAVESNVSRTARIEKHALSVPQKIVASGQHVVIGHISSYNEDYRRPGLLTRDSILDILE